MLHASSYIHLTSLNKTIHCIIDSLSFIIRFWNIAVEAFTVSGGKGMPSSKSSFELQVQPHSSNSASFLFLLPSIRSAAIAKHMLHLVSPAGWCWSMECLGSCPVVTLCWRQNDHRERYTQDRAKSPQAWDHTHRSHGTQAMASYRIEEMLMTCLSLRAILWKSSIQDCSLLDFLFSQSSFSSTCNSTCSPNKI